MNVQSNWIWVLILLCPVVLCLSCSCGDDDDDDDSGDDDDSADDDSADDDSAGCEDFDQDTYGENCDAGPDCNDADADVHTIKTGYIDSDGDGFAGTGLEICTDGTLPAGYGDEQADCDDADMTIYPGAMEFPDDGIDQDCTDGDWVSSDDEGYYVDTAGGDDQNPGTKAEPFATIQKGIDVAQDDPDKPNLFIAQGSYTEDAAVGSFGKSVNLFGGYQPGAWTRDIKAETTLMADAGTSGLHVGTESRALIQGMTLIGTDGGNSQGITVDDFSTIFVADCRLETPDGPGANFPLYVPAGSDATVIRTSIDTGESTDGRAVGIFAGNTRLTIIDCDIHVTDSVIDAAGVSLSGGSAFVRGLLIEVETSDGDVVGFNAGYATVDMSDFSITIGDTVKTVVGYRGATCTSGLENGSIAIGDTDGNVSMGVYNIFGSLTADGLAIETGSVAGLNYGLWAEGVDQGDELILTNSLIVTGDAAGENAALYATYLNTVVGNNTLIAGSGATRIGVSHVAGSDSSTDPIYYNNHIEAGSASSDSVIIQLIDGGSDFGYYLESNNLYGDADCLLSDGTACLTDIDEVNAGQFAGARTPKGNLNEDPGFAGATDRRLAAGSPLIDAGSTPMFFLPSVYEEWGRHDLEGHARPAGATWDIGAYEAD